MNSPMSAAIVAPILAEAVASKDRPELVWYASLNDDTRSLIDILVASLARQIPGVGPLTGLEIIHAIHCRYVDGQGLRVSRARARVARHTVNTRPHTKNAVGR